MAIISSVFSAVPEISWWGIPTENEGLASIIGYATMSFATYRYIRTEKDVHTILNIVCVLAGVISLLIIIDKSTSPLSVLLYNTPGTTSGLSLLYGNSANCGAVLCTLLPLILASAVREPNIILRCAKGISAGILVFGVLVSLSSTALYGSVAAALFVLIPSLISKKHRLHTIVTIISALIALLISGAILDDGFFSTVQHTASNAGTYQNDHEHILTDLELNGNQLSMEFEEMTVTVTSTDEQLRFYINDNEDYLIYADDAFILSDPKAEGIKFIINKSTLYVDMGYAAPLKFGFSQDTFCVIGIHGGVYTDLDNEQYPQFSKYYGFGTGRGYTWLNTLPILKKSLIKGVGVGQFALYFPQSDIVGCLNTHGTAPLFTDKPHNMYLQMFCATGLPSLLIFLCLALLTLKNGLFSAFKSKSTGLLGVTGCAFCILLTGLLNDWSISYGIWFWICAGMIAAMQKTANIHSTAPSTNTERKKRKHES